MTGVQTCALPIWFSFISIELSERYVGEDLLDKVGDVSVTFVLLFSWGWRG